MFDFLAKHHKVNTAAMLADDAKRRQTEATECYHRMMLGATEPQAVAERQARFARTVDRK